MTSIAQTLSVAILAQAIGSWAVLRLAGFRFAAMAADDGCSRSVDVKAESVLLRVLRDIRQAIQLEPRENLGLPVSGIRDAWRGFGGRSKHFAGAVANGLRAGLACYRPCYGQMRQGHCYGGQGVLT